jgi:hypothetical protein
MRLRLLFLVMFAALATAGVWSQPLPLPPSLQVTRPMPAQPQAGDPSPRKETSPSMVDAPLNVPVFQFHFRTAFLLTPAMVAAIQSASLSTQGSKSNQNSSSNREDGPAWESPILREVSLMSPLGIKIQSEQIVAVIVFMPIELVKQNLTMLVQNQIFARNPDSSIQMNTSVHTIRVPLGALFYYYPLGGDSKQGAPVAIEILVNQK